jgi:hypothetical protein
MGYSVEKASKALIETGSKHLAAALDWFVLPVDHVFHFISHFFSQARNAPMLGARR